MVNQEMLHGSWNQVKGKIRERWGELTDNDLQQFQGNMEDLIGLIQRKTGETREKVHEFISRCFSESGKEMSGMAESERPFTAQFGEGLQQAAARVSDRVRASYDGAGQMVHERPGQSLAAAFGAGMITGVLLGILLRAR